MQAVYHLSGEELWHIVHSLFTALENVFSIFSDKKPGAQTDGTIYASSQV